MSRRLLGIVIMALGIGMCISNAKAVLEGMMGFQSEFTRTPTGFVPQQDKGYLLLNVQLPDSSAVERTQRWKRRERKTKIPLKTYERSRDCPPGIN